MVLVVSAALLLPAGTLSATPRSFSEFCISLKTPPVSFLSFPELRLAPIPACQFVTPGNLTRIKAVYHWQYPREEEKRGLPKKTKGYCDVTPSKKEEIFTPAVNSRREEKPTSEDGHKSQLILSYKSTQSQPSKSQLTVSRTEGHEEQNLTKDEIPEGQLDISRRTLLCFSAMAASLSFEPSTVLADIAVTGVTGEGVAVGGEREEFKLPKKLKNRYWVLRHGKSFANEAGLIVSGLENGKLKKYGLSPLGQKQAEAAGEKFLHVLEERNIPRSKVRIFASPFSRTQQTARAVANALNWEKHDSRFQTAEGLRERYFGPSMELGSHDQYSNVWMADLCDPTVPPSEGGESVTDVTKRVANVIWHVESQCDSCAVLFVSHGDTIQILQAALFGNGLLQYKPNNGNTSPLFALNANGETDMSIVLSKHRGFALQTGELRALELV